MRGYSSIEMIVAFSILIVMATVMLLIVIENLERTRVVTFVSDVRTLKAAVRMYYADTGRLPDGFDSLIRGARRYIKESREVRFRILNERFYMISPWDTLVDLKPCGADNKCCVSSMRGLSVNLAVKAPDGRAIPFKALRRVDMELDDGEPSRGTVFLRGEVLCVLVNI